MIRSLNYRRVYFGKNPSYIALNERDYYVEPISDPSLVQYIGHIIKENITSVRRHLHEAGYPNFVIDREISEIYLNQLARLSATSDNRCIVFVTAKDPIVRKKIMESLKDHKVRARLVDYQFKPVILGRDPDHGQGEIEEYYFIEWDLENYALKASIRRLENLLIFHDRVIRPERYKIGYFKKFRNLPKLRYETKTPDNYQRIHFVVGLTEEYRQQSIRSGTITELLAGVNLDTLEGSSFDQLPGAIQNMILDSIPNELKKPEAQN